VDVISGLATGANHALFVNVRGTTDDSDQQLLSLGLGFRVLLDDPGVILGANVYYDRIDSPSGNTFEQLGLGAEVLSKWVDARFNYYLPDGDRGLVRSFRRTSSNSTAGAPQLVGQQFRANVVDRRSTTRFDIFEEAREGWNAEVGFLVPGLEQFVDLRIFAGAYSYKSPRGGNTEGFKARAEARVTEGVTFDLEYWDDAELVGGNWVGGVRVSVPFDLGNLFSGKNPFEGAGEMFKRGGTHDLRSRMDQMVWRSHRVQTSEGGPQNGGTTNETDNRTITTQRSFVPPPKVVVPPPSNGGGGTEEQPK
jgi:hypothetical protein